MNLTEPLDELAQAVFGGERGRARVEPLLREFERFVGPLHDDDEAAALLHAIRTDWALCDATPGGAPPGESWAIRAARGRVAEVQPDETTWLLATSVASVFEVWPGETTWVRDLLRGFVAPLRDVMHGLEPERGRPAAIWETRVVFVPDGVRLCRPALEFPDACWPALTQLPKRFPVRPGELLAHVRRSRLTWVRAGRRGLPRL